MPFEKVQPEKLSRSVVRQIELLILRGILKPGERLPSERELSENFGVSRPSLREAVGELQEAGLLVSKANSGIFVAEGLNWQFAPALTRLISSHEEAVFDYIDFRRDMEGLAAERAARLGSDTDLAVIDSIFRRMEEAHKKRDPSDEAGLDVEFHLAIIDASHNVVMQHMMRSMYQLLREGVFYNRQIIFKRRSHRDTILEQHRAINAALQAREGSAARKAIETHMDFVTATFNDHLRTEKNEAIARLRLDHEAGRC